MAADHRTAEPVVRGRTDETAGIEMKQPHDVGAHAEAGAGTAETHTRAESRSQRRIDVAGDVDVWASATGHVENETHVALAANPAQAEFGSGVRAQIGRPRSGRELVIAARQPDG